MRLIKKLFSTLITLFVIGLFGSLVWIQYDQEFQKKCKTKIISFLEKEWDANITAEKVFVNFFARRIEFKKGIVTPRTKKCQWRFQQARVRFSLLNFLFKSKVCLYLSFKNIHAQTEQKSKQFDLVQHLSKVFERKPGGLEVCPRELHLENVTLDAMVHDKKITLAFQGNFLIRKNKFPNKKKPSEWRGHAHLRAGDIFFNDVHIFSNFSGSNSFYKTSLDTTWTATFAHYFMQQGCSEKKYRLSGAWNAAQPSLRLQGEDVDIIVTQERDKIRFSGCTPISMLAQMYTKVTTQHQELGDVGGVCSFDCALQKNEDNFTVNGTLAGEKLRYKNYTCTSLNVKDFQAGSKKISGKVTGFYDKNISFLGDFLWKIPTRQLHLNFCSDADVALSKTLTKKDKAAWLVKPKDFRGTLVYKNNMFSGDYFVALSQELSDQRIETFGTFCLRNGDLIFDGNVFDGQYHAIASVNDLIFREIFFKKDRKTLISLKTKNKESKKLEGFIFFPLIQSFLSFDVRRIVLGSQTYVGISLDQDDLKKITGSLWLHKGTLYLPESRNLVKKVNLSYELFPEEKKVIINNPKINFSQGVLQGKRIALLFENDYALKALYAPISFKKIFLNWKNDLYAFLSGDFVLSKQPKGVIQIDGDLVISKALFKNNPFSDAVGSAFRLPFNVSGYHENGFDMTIRVKTERPISVKTSSIKTKARLDLNVEFLNNDEAPKLEGILDLEGGYLQFLDNKLFIESGSVHFVPSQLRDPLISLVAKNKISRYLITLQATGSLQKPNIFLESSPTLREEQILGVLLSGSEHASLKTDFPVMVMQNLHTLLLGNKKITPKATAFFEKLVKPLKYVQISPNFTDQTGRGGIKGIVTVDVGEQVQAQIQKNFNLQDDLAFQVEYQLSDDVNLKVVKDQRGELGSEVEVRFKF